MVRVIQSVIGCGVSLLDSAGPRLWGKLPRWAWLNASLSLCQSQHKRHMHELTALQLRCCRCRRQCRMCWTASGNNNGCHGNHLPVSHTG